MMESLAYEIVLNDLEAFKRVLDKLDRGVPDKQYFQVIDAAVNRFSCGIDSFLDFLKLYMQNCLDIYIEPVSPCMISQEALNANVVFKEEYDLLMDCVTSRNQISHAYNQEIAQQLLKGLRSYYGIMHTIITRIDL